MKTTADRLKELMDENGWKQVDILNKIKPVCDKYHIKIGKSTLSQYVNGKVKPGQTKLTVLSIALGVNEGWLMGLDCPKERDDAIQKKQDGVDVDPLDFELAGIISKLSKEKKREALRYLKYLAES